MKIMKKALSAVLAGAMALSMSVAVFAATNISASEQKILDQAKVKAAELGVPETSSQFEQYYSQAVSYCQQYDMTETEVNGALKAMDEAADIASAKMKEAGVSSLFDLDKDTLTALAAQCTSVIQKEFDAVGIKVKLSADGTVTFVKENTTNNTPNNSKDSSSTAEPVKNNTVFQTSKVIKQTGSDLTATVVVAAAVVGAVAACGVIAKKKGLFEGTQA